MKHAKSHVLLAGEPQPVTRARYDWQVYDPARPEKGGVRWHTVEGPFVLRRKNLYYQMFSGGNWQNLTYGVSYAVSERIERGDEWEQVADGERGRVLAIDRLDWVGERMTVLGATDTPRSRSMSQTCR